MQIVVFKWGRGRFAAWILRLVAIRLNRDAYTKGSLDSIGREFAILTILPAEKGICRVPEIDYMELRIFSENWESAFFESWILQVILSELLHVPTTIETGVYNARLNLYDPDSPFEYGNTDDIEALTVAKNVGGDCRKASRNEDTYQGCAHFAPEVWDSDGVWVLGQVYDKTVEPPQGLGMLGQESGL